MQVQFELVENLLAPEMFAGGVTGFSLGDGVVRLTFETMRVNNHTNLSTRVVIGRIVMPISGAQSLAAGLYDFLKTHGLDPVPKPPADQIQ